MKKIIVLLIVILATMSINAQVMKVYNTKTSTTEPVATYTDGDDATYKIVCEKAPSDPNAQIVKVYNTKPATPELVATYTNSSTNTVKVVFDEAPDPNLLSGKFSVSATKKVKFTKSNLYWDGSAFKFEANQTDFQTSFNSSHVNLFYWTNITDYQTNSAYYMPYTGSWLHTNGQSTSDKCWCGKDNPLTVEGTSGLYVLTGGENGEWDYLLKSRANASNLYKLDVTVTNGDTNCEQCLIIAPDDYDYTNKPLASSYTLDEVNALGLVCLPSAGYRYTDDLYVYDDDGKIMRGEYLSSTPSSDDSSQAYELYFKKLLDTKSKGGRNYGYAVRLVRSN